MHTIAELEKLTGISAARLRNYLKDVTPDISLGRSVGYTMHKLRIAVAEAHPEIIALFTSQEAPADV